MGTGVGRVKQMFKPSNGLARMRSGKSQLSRRSMMIYRTAFPLLAFLASSACGGTEATSPANRDAGIRATDVVSEARTPAARSGDLNITKNCIDYNGAANDICTIATSNLKAIPVGTTITYLSSAIPPTLNTDVVINPPGPGNNKAFGHCTLNLATGIGVCTISGGTGKFTHLEATVAVSNIGGANFAWDGTYTYGPGE